jgi:CubicO group peptidase (beta-lactamase class C family)
MRERVFDPLDMKHAGFGAPGRTGALAQPRGHGADGKPVESEPDADNPVAVVPAGSVHAPLGDWARFVSGHLHGARGEGPLLRPQTYRKLHTPGPAKRSGRGGYARGWLVAKRDWADGTVLTHSGSNTLWYAVVSIAPAKNLAVLVASNHGGRSAAKAADKAVGALIDAHFHRPENRRSRRSR